MTSTAYQIKDVAARSGFSAATLRYYEEIGLLPEPDRTDAGYRVYNPAVLDRLAFIARAKQLGCSLDEIGDLTTAWEGGRCGPVQEQLRSVVADKLTRAQQQVVDLAALTAQLRQAAADLERHRPDGPCDDRCGCVTDPAHTDQPEDVQPTARPATEAPPPVACTLEAGSMRGRLEDWQTLLAHVKHREPLNGGLRATFAPSAPTDELMRLTSAEQHCCQFFRFAITIDTRGVALEITAPDDALPVVHALFGAPA